MNVDEGLSNYKDDFQSYVTLHDQVFDNKIVHTIVTVFYVLLGYSLSIVSVRPNEIYYGL